MSNVQEIARLMKDLEAQLVVCMRCGMCQAVCPLYAETGREADVARGKLALLDGLLQEMFNNPEGVNTRLNKCLLCGSCAAACPSGVNVLEIFIKARTILTGYMGLPFPKKLVLRGMLAHPELFDYMAEWGARFQKLIFKQANDILGTSCARFAAPLLGGRHVKLLASEPFHHIASRTKAPSGSSGIRVAFFIGCLIDKFFPQIAEAAMTVLDHHDVRVHIPDNQACCGIPALSSGDINTFNSLLNHNLAIFETESFDYLITCCATCTSTLKKIWPMMNRERTSDVHARVSRLASKTLDINEFLVGQLGIEAPKKGTVENSVAVTYHDPCHLKKSLGVFAEPRTLIHANPDYQLNEMAEPEWCCGLGGSFNLQYYGISSAIGSRKKDQILETGCSVVATGCPACMLQLSDMLSKSDNDIRVMHPVEIYSQYLTRQKN